jgi:hypothetical protein
MPTFKSFKLTSATSPPASTIPSLAAAAQAAVSPSLFGLELMIINFILFSSYRGLLGLTDFSFTMHTLAWPDILAVSRACSAASTMARGSL